MNEAIRLDLPDEAATERLGAALAARASPLAIYLHGDLGAGKTTLARGMLQALGHEGSVRSPTYTLLEPYRLGGMDCLHLDLYRLADPGELEFLGLRDFDMDQVVMIVEWPIHGAGCLPPQDLDIRLSYAGSGRIAVLEARSAAGAERLRLLAVHDEEL